MGDGEIEHVRRERSLLELIFATFLVAFLVGFVCVLCMGNYFRAKRAMERQRELRRRRLAMQQERGGHTNNHNNSSHTTDSPRSLATESTANTDNQNNNNNNERKYLLGQHQRGRQPPPELPRRRGLLNAVSDTSPTEDLLLFPDRDSSSEKPKIMRV
jgi:type II secretory pathway pseudopilin PulG